MMSSSSRYHAGSLWDFAIRESRQNDKMESTRKTGEATIIVAGGKKSGKSTIIRSFMEEKTSDIKPTLALDYTYKKFTNTSGKSMIQNVCHIWELGGGTVFSHLLENLLRYVDPMKMTFVCVLDLSQLSTMWFTLDVLISDVQKKFMNLVNLAQHGEKPITELLEAAAWSRTCGIDNHPDKQHMNPFPVPLVIVGSKYDVFQNFDPEQKKIVSRALRCVAHTLGAALVFVSAHDSSLTRKVRDVIWHTVFGLDTSVSACTDYNKAVLMLPGRDSLGAISETSHTREMWKQIFITQFPQIGTEKTDIPEDPNMDPRFREPTIDGLRAQKDQELERYRREMERHRRQTLI